MLKDARCAKRNPPKRAQRERCKKFPSPNFSSILQNAMPPNQQVIPIFRHFSSHTEKKKHGIFFKPVVLDKLGHFSDQPKHRSYCVRL